MIVRLMPSFRTGIRMLSDGVPAAALDRGRPL